MTVVAICGVICAACLLVLGMCVVIRLVLGLPLWP